MSAVLFAVLTSWALRHAVRRPGRPATAGPPPRRWQRGATGPIAALSAALGARREQRADVGLPEAVDAVASAVGSGRSVADGLALAAAAAPPGLAAELGAVVRAVHLGLPIAVAVDRWAEGSAVDGAPLVAAAVGLAGDAGGDVEQALAGVAATLRERRALGREIRALSAQARLSATTIAVAPIGFGAVALAADGDTAAFLLGSTGGLTCLAVGLVLDLAGFRWMRRLAAGVR